MRLAGVIPLCLLASALAAQETRGVIFGRVLDPSGAPVAGAAVAVENTDTNTSADLLANPTGYYEANLLLPGNYRVSAAVSGFKKTVRDGIVLPLSTRLEINLALELGAITESVSVTAQAPLLDTSTVSSGRVMDNRSVMDLPVIANNTMVLVKMTPGIQTSGVNDYLGPHSNVGASDYSIGGNVGGNEWSIDGVPNNGAGRRSAYLPHSDTVQEMKVETSNFDASIGHTTGVSVTMMTRTGANDYHGTLTEQHWRISLQRQLGADMLVDVAYAATWSDRVPLTQSLSPLPERFWAGGLVRNNDIANNLNSNVTNPFRLANLAGLQTSDPLIYQDLSTLGFFTSGTIRKNQLLRAFPHMSGVSTATAPLGEARTHGLEVTFQRRFSKGFNLNLGYTRLRTREADFFNDEFDSLPAWRQSNDGRPHRLVASGIYELPFGKGRPFATGGLWSHLLGGFQIAATYECQPGPLIGWGNVFYYGEIEDIAAGVRTLDRWFNTDGFERVAARGPAAYHRRVFPTRIEGLRADFANQWNTNLQRDFRLKEGLTLQLRVDALNLQNRTQFQAPNATPTSTDFGRVTAQTNTRNRFIQVQGRLRF